MMKSALTFLFFTILQAVGSIAWGDSISLPEYYFNKGTEWITAGGSWVGDSPESGDPYFKEFAIQTSALRCQKADGKCFEARAVLKSSIMLSNLIEYKIQRWDSNEINAILDGTAATIEIRLDLKTDRISLVHTEKSDKRLDRAHLANGTEAIKKARMK